MEIIEKNNVITAIVNDLSEAIANEIMKNMTSEIEKKVETAVSKYLDGSDFTYMLEDAVKESMESHVEDYISGISLSVRID